MSKLDSLKKRVVRNAVLAVVVLGVVGGGTFGLITYIDQKTEEKRQKTADVERYSAQTADLERKIGFVQQSIGTFTPLKARLERGELSIDRDKARRLLDVLRRQLRLDGFRLEISAEDKFTGGETARFQAVTASYCTIRMSFTATSDLQVFGFLDRLRNALPGYVFLSDVKVTSQGLLDAEILQKIRTGEMPALVNAEIGILWVGLKPTATTPAGVAP